MKTVGSLKNDMIIKEICAFIGQQFTQFAENLISIIILHSGY